ncbi:polymer-forming cytoskeletal protein [Altererythrobacter sp.]|nr:polymer-forming cytoskeletal protein [Altererythrobacter sp.]
MAKPSSSSGSFSVIGGDVTITGNIAASTELHVDGTIDGDISCTSLVQGEGSIAKGAIKAESARLAGTVEGSIDARELVILRTATIKGDVHYDALTIEQGAAVDGRFAPRANGSAALSEPVRNKAAADEAEPKLSIAT